MVTALEERFGFSGNTSRIWFIDYCTIYYSSDIWIVVIEKGVKIYVSLQLRVQNAVSAQPCVGKLGISLVLLNFLGCNFRLWFKTT